MPHSPEPSPAVYRRLVVEAAREALTGLVQVLHQVPGEQLPGWLGLLDEVTLLAGAGRVAVTHEAVQRGEVAGSQCGSVTDWVRTHAPSLAAAGGAAAVAKVVDAAARPESRAVTEAVVAGRVAPQVGVTVLSEFDRLRGQIEPGAEAAVLDGLLTCGATGGSSRVRALRAALLARYGLAEQLQRDQDHAARQLSLSTAVGLGGGLWEYRLVCDVEAKAVLEAAIGPWSAPQPGPDGERDSRLVGQRRGQALIETLRRAMATTGMVPSGVKATVFVTVDYDTLRARLGGIGTTLGVAGAGDLLGPDTIRRLACDAEIVPMVLGSDGEVLDVGRAHRLVTPGMLKALWFRDRHCTFPGCTVPATWTDAHHLQHWSDGAPTSLANLALLCGRHHTIVHRDRLHGGLDPGGQVTWDRIPGSYDHYRGARPPPDQLAS